MKNNQDNNNADYLLQSAENVYECLQLLEQRFASGLQFYTEISPAADTLISLNPFRPIQMSKEHILFRYAQQALLNSSNAAILVTGESGSGKTFVINQLISYFGIESILMHTNPILEAFGNASTIQNENSSRFGKYIELQFEKNKKLTAVKLRTYLLEKTRATRPMNNTTKSGERNFHIFYQMIAGADPSERLDWHLTDQLVSSTCQEETASSEADRSNWRIVKEAFLKHLNISRDHYSHIFRLISAICHLNSQQQTERDAFKEAAHLLGFQSEDCLENYVSFQVLNMLNCVHSVRRLCTPTERILRKEALIKLIYGQLFKWLVKTLNERLSLTPPTHHATPHQRSHEGGQIGLLDIYGFENLQTNSLEQLCINYANERLHQIYIDIHLKRVQQECQSELNEWININGTMDDPMANNKQLLIQLEKNLFNIINEECILRRLSSQHGTDSLVAKIVATQTRLIHDGRGTTGTISNSFVVRHYVGRVSYRVEELIQKNKDQTPDDLLLFLVKSSNSFLLDCLQREQPWFKNKKKTVIDKFKLNLNVLIGRLLDETNVIYYVRCIRPNELKQPYLFDKRVVRRQLVACGLHSLIALSKRLGSYFRHRLDYLKFYFKYFPLNNPFESTTNTKTKTMNKKSPMTIDELKQWTESLLLSNCGGGSSDGKEDEYRLGNTKIFLNDRLMHCLNEQLSEFERRAESAVRIQSNWRMYAAKKDFSKMLHSTIRIQKWWKRKMKALKKKNRSSNAELSSSSGSSGSSCSSNSTITLLSLSTSNEDDSTDDFCAHLLRK